MDQDLVDEGSRNLVSYFQAKSYFDVKVNSELDKRSGPGYGRLQGGPWKPTSRVGSAL